MKFLTNAMLATTLFIAGFAQAAEPVKANEINVIDIQKDAQAYIMENISVISLKDLFLESELLFVKSGKALKKDGKELIASNELIAE